MVSAAIYSGYYSCTSDFDPLPANSANLAFHSTGQIFAHREFVSPSRSAALGFPSLAICSNAARSSAHVLDTLRQRGLVHRAFTFAPITVSTYRSCSSETTILNALYVITLGGSKRFRPAPRTFRLSRCKHSTHSFSRSGCQTLYQRLARSRTDYIYGDAMLRRNGQTRNSRRDSSFGKIYKPAVGLHIVAA